MIAFLTSRLGIGLIGIVGVVLMYAGWSIQVSNLRGTISAEQEKTRTVQGQFDGYKLMVEQQISDERAARVIEVTEALKQRDMMQEEADRLRGLMNAATRERNALATENRRILANAPRTSVSPLDAATIDFYRRLREQQLATSAGRNSPPP